MDNIYLSSMNHHTTAFGQYIAEMRSLRKFACRQLAQTIGISTGYLSQLEHGIRLNPDPQLLLDIAKALSLSAQESQTLFDLYAEETGQLPPDITEYLLHHKNAQKAIRQAHDAGFSAEDWEHFIEQLKK